VIGNTERPRKGPGRPTKKSPERVAKIVELAREGKTTEEIAEIVGLNKRTIYEWMERDWQFSALLKENKGLADENVEVSLFKRATGYSHPEEKIFYDKKAGEVVRADTVMHYPPDPTSMIFWLKNRKPKEWRDKQDHDIKVEYAEDVRDTAGDKTSI
jgi:hypothetical protein